MVKRYDLKMAVLLTILFLLIGISFSPVFNSNELQEDYVVLDYKNRDIPIFKEIGEVGTYHDYISSREQKPYYFENVYETTSRNLPLVVIYVESDLFSPLSNEIFLYNKTLGKFGYNTTIFQVSGVTPQDLKDQLIYYWGEGYNLHGAALIGDLPTEWFHHENDFYGPAEFPCDLFLMDLDGTWTDSDGDDMYDIHTDGVGDTAPEIYVGRIDASKIPGDEISILKKYFAKVYDFWRGDINQTLYGLTYTDHDWANIQYFRHDLGYAYENYDPVWYPDVYRDDYVNNRIPGTYEFIQLSCHSSSQGHSFASGGWASNDEIRSAPPRAPFYNLFCCSSLRFTDNNCLGYAYILDTDTPSLSVVGSAKTGSMLDFRYFYEPIGNGSSFGTALKEWFEFEYPYSNSDISWFYGMTILGDPTLIIHCLKNFPPTGENISGPTEGVIGEEYTFCVDVFDDQEDDIYCIWDWGDGTNTGWLGPYSSGETVCTSHSWNSTGYYDIKINLKDDMESESGWSEPYQFKILLPAKLDLGDVNGSFFKINAYLKNIGEVDTTTVQWSINIKGGLILTGRTSNGELPSILPDESIEFKSKTIIGFGNVIVNVKAEIPENTVSREVKGKVFLFYIHVNPSGGI